jgi:MFS family permease
MAMSIGLALGPISAGLISDLAGLRAAFYIAGIVGMLGVLGFMYLMRLEKPE